MTIQDDRMTELADYQIDHMDSGDIIEIVMDSLKEYWMTYPDDFEAQWEEYQAIVGDTYEDGD